MEEKRFIVVGFNQGIGNILQRGGFMNWYIERGVKFYKRLSCAIKAAKSLKFGFDKVCVYEIGEEDEISSSSFKNWDEKIKFELDKKK